MANKGYIIVSSGVKPVHSFDLWGPLVDPMILGEDCIRIFEEVARREKMDLEIAAKTINDYRALNNGEPRATGPKKIEIIMALETPTLRHPDLVPDYAKSIYPEAIKVLQEIYTAGESAIIFSTKSPGWVSGYLVPLVGDINLPIYAGVKTDPQSYFQVYAAEKVKGNRIVTHTADELPELETAVATGLFGDNKGRVIFVNRNNVISRKQAEESGIDI